MKTKPCLTQEDCKKIGAACEAEARKNKWNVVIAILDDGGHLLWLARMDGATPANSEIAIAKGRSAAVSRRTIQALAEGRDPGDLTTIEDPAALEQIRRALKTSTEP